MARGKIGMDPNEVRAFSGLLKDKAIEIFTIKGQLTSKLAGTVWDGADATKFRSDWDSIYVKQLTQIMHDLVDHSNTANTQASQQDNASAR